MNNIFKYLILFTLSFTLYLLNAQDVEYARQVFKKLTSTEFAGRSLADSGIYKAADFIENEFKNNGISVFSQLNSYKQCFSLPQSLIIENAKVKLDNKELILGHDYLPLPTSKTLKGEFNIKYIAINKNSKNKKILKAISKDPTDFYFLDFTDAYLLKAKDIEEYNTLKSLYYSTKSIPLGYIVLDSSSFFYTAKSFFNINYPVIMLNTNTYDNSLKPQKVYIDYKVKTVSNAELCNIVGYIPGIKYPDSFIVIGAHYDHLGKIADKHFPGANDNASGTVMLLDLAKKLATEDEKPNYSIIFISFAGEEIGLLGSKYFTTNPPVDLKNIKLMINLDMVGTGKDGISVVNAKKNPSIYNKLKLINEEKNYVVDMIEGGASCSSDHCPFDQRGVPAIFIFSRDKDYRYYHVMEDDYEILPLDGYEGIFKLIYDLIMNY